MVENFRALLSPANRKLLDDADWLDRVNNGREGTFDEILPSGVRLRDANLVDLEQGATFYKSVAEINSRMARMAEGLSNYTGR